VQIDEAMEKYYSLYYPFLALLLQTQIHSLPAANTTRKKALQKKKLANRIYSDDLNIKEYSPVLFWNYVIQEIFTWTEGCSSTLFGTLSA